MRKLIFILFVLPFIHTFAQSNLTPELLWKLGRVSEPRLSPDGKKVIYSVRTFNVPENKGNTDIWILNLANSQAKPLTSQPVDETSARWLPGGKKISFLAPDKN